MDRFGIGKKFIKQYLDMVVHYCHATILLDVNIVQKSYLSALSPGCK